MAERKGFLASLFGGGCSCGMGIEEETEQKDSGKKVSKKGGCCNMEIVEETEEDTGHTEKQ